MGGIGRSEDALVEMDPASSLTGLAPRFNEGGAVETRDGSCTAEPCAQRSYGDFCSKTMCTSIYGQCQETPILRSYERDGKGKACRPHATATQPRPSQITLETMSQGKSDGLLYWKPGRMAYSPEGGQRDSVTLLQPLLFLFSVTAIGSGPTNQNIVFPGSYRWIRTRDLVAIQHGSCSPALK